MSRPTFVLAALLAAMLPGAGIAAPQVQGCIGDDGFASVPCCQPIAAPTLPQFPRFQIGGFYCCVKDCQLEARFRVNVLTGHIPVTCDYAVVLLTVTPGAVTDPGFNGFLLAKYSRTWFEPTATANQFRQVWRFLINGDLNPTSGARPCPLPPEPVGAPVHFHGHIDYACEVDVTGARVFRMLMSLHHLPDCIEHNAFSCVPLNSHPDRSYHLVAPANFVCQPVPVPQGALADEAVRSMQFPAGLLCLGEAPVVQGAIATAATNCLCSPLVGGPWAHQRFTGVVQCAGATANFQSIPLGLPLPPLPNGFVTLPIGNWTGAAGTFPGDRTLLVHWGVVQYIDPCNTADVPIHVVTGVTTANHAGFLYNKTPAPGYKAFVDLQNMLLAPTTSTSPFRPGWGCLYFSKLVWNLNL